MPTNKKLSQNSSGCGRLIGKLDASGGADAPKTDETRRIVNHLASACRLVAKDPAGGGSVWPYSGYLSLCSKIWASDLLAWSREQRDIQHKTVSAGSKKR